MAISHNWKITAVDYQTADGYIFNAHWDVTATDGDYSARAYGCETLERPDNLIPYESLSESTVVSWVIEKLSNTRPNPGAPITFLQLLEENLANEIKQQIAPTTKSGLPWAPAEESLDAPE